MLVAEGGSSSSQTQDQDSSEGHDLLELYCGNGNFTVPLACNFRQVLATEVAKTLVEAAQWNAEANKVCAMPQDN